MNYKIHNGNVYSVFMCIFTPLEQGKFLSEKHRNEAGAESGAFLGRFL